MNDFNLTEDEILCIYSLKTRKEEGGNQLFHDLCYNYRKELKERFFSDIRFVNLFNR
jgi:hypothetical protein